MSRTTVPWRRSPLSDDGSQLAIANRRGSFHRDMPAAVLVYNTRSDALRQALATPEKAEVHSVAVVPNSERLLVGYSSRRENDVGRCFCVLWDMESGNPVCELPVEGAVRVSPDGRWIAGGTLVGSPFQAGGGTPRIDSTRLTVWETDAGKAVRTFEYASPMLFTFSPNGERVLVALSGRRATALGWLSRAGLSSGTSSRASCVSSRSSGKAVCQRGVQPRRPAAIRHHRDGLMVSMTTWTIGSAAGARQDGRGVADPQLFVSDSYNGREDLFFYTSATIHRSGLPICRSRRFSRVWSRRPCPSIGGE